MTSGQGVHSQAITQSRPGAALPRRQGDIPRRHLGKGALFPSALRARRWVPVLLLGGAALLTESDSLAAQVNTERLRRSEISEGWFGSTRIEVTLRSGNVDLTLIGVGGRLDHVRRSTTTFLVGAGDFGWQGGERFSNQGLLHLRRTFRTNRTIAPEVFLQANYDKSRSLSFRGLAGAGARFTLLARPTWQLVAATAYLFEREVLDLPPTALHPDRTVSHRWSSYVSTRLAAGPRLAIVATAYVQPKFDDFSDVRVLTDARMALELSGSVSVTMTLNVRYDGEPPDDIDPVDATWKTGFAVEW